MKELKFRVYDKKEGCYSDEPFSIDQLGICYIQDEDGYWEEIDEERFVVEQHTGLKDKNGKEIYEGDIVKAGHLRLKFEVKYNIPCTKFWMQNNGLVEEFEDWNEETEIEVIGNIHENPDVLGGEE